MEKKYFALARKLISTSRNKVSLKEFATPKNILQILIPPARMKDSLKRYISTMRKSAFTDRNI